MATAHVSQVIYGLSKCNAVIIAGWMGAGGDFVSDLMRVSFSRLVAWSEFERSQLGFWGHKVYR
jgi:hypothetical protein